MTNENLPTLDQGRDFFTPTVDRLVRLSTGNKRTSRTLLHRDSSKLSPSLFLVTVHASIRMHHGYEIR
jgi:hypothetical protein